MANHQGYNHFTDIPESLSDALLKRSGHAKQTAMNELRNKAKDFESAESRVQYRVLYLDLDGTVRKGYDELVRWVNGPKDVEVFEGIPKTLARYKTLGWRLVAVTNQGGIALGHVTMEDALAALAETNRQCGDVFDLMFMCRHHPDAKDPQMAHCLCRKPRYGSIVEAQITLSERFGGIYPPHKALFVGDRPEDRECAEGAGIKFMDAAEWRKMGSTEPLTIEV